jgi:inosose dehydratase
VWFPADERQTPWQRFLDEVVEAGYERIELGPVGYLPTDADVLNEELGRRGLTVPATFVMQPLEGDWEVLRDDIERTCPVLGAAGGESVILIDDVYTDLFTGEQIAPRDLDDEAWQRLIENTHLAAEHIRDRFGMSTLLHPHAETHLEYEEQIERFLADTDPQLVNLCFDVGHHAYRGGDPIEFVRRYRDRVPYLHLKSVDRDVQRRVEDEGIPFATAVAMDMFVEPALGAVDFEALRDTLEEIDYEGYGIVEQDLYPAPFDKPLPIAKRTRAYLREVGIG